MTECQPRVGRRITAAVAVLAVLLTSAVSSADTRVWAGVGAANLSTVGDGGLWGPAAQLGVNLGLGEFWALTADVGGSHHFANAEQELPADRVGALSLGLRYNLDVFKYVPYLGLAVTGFLDAPLVDDAALQTNLGAKLSLGAEWRFSRTWSVGFRGELHAMATDLSRYPVYSIVGFDFGVHFR